MRVRFDLGFGAVQHLQEVGGLCSHPGKNFIEKLLNKSNANTVAVFMIKLDYIFRSNNCVCTDLKK
jgi:hypothetical protein